MKNNYSVYKHTFPNGKVYIGITSQALEKRFANGRGYKKCPKMHSAIMKYGWNNVEHELLYSGLSKEEAEQKEIELIAFFGSVKNGYNVDHGGNVCGTHSIETRNKISAGNVGKPRPRFTEEKRAKYSKMFSGDKNPFYGKHHSEAVKAKHGDFMKGNQFNKGKHHSEEFKAKKSQQMREKYANGNNPRSKKVMAISGRGDIRMFNSLRIASMIVGVSPATLLKHIRRCDEFLGSYWRYESEAGQRV